MKNECVFESAKNGHWNIKAVEEKTIHWKQEQIEIE